MSTPEERIAALEQSFEKLTARVGQLESGLTISTANNAATASVLTKRIEALEAPNPVVVKAKSVLSYLWANKGTIAPWVLLAIVTMVGPGKGCDWKLPTIGTGCVGCNPLNPPDPAPIPVEGLRVLIVYESADMGGYSRAQINAINSANLYAALAPKLAKGPTGAPEFRVFDKDVDLTNESALWQTAMKRPRDSLPWLIISNGTTNSGYEGPLPKENTEAEVLKLVSKYEK